MFQVISIEHITF